MQKQIKIIVGIGLVVVALGAWWYNSGTGDQKDQQSSQTESSEVARDSNLDKEKKTDDMKVVPSTEGDIAGTTNDESEFLPEDEKTEQLPSLDKPAGMNQPAGEKKAETEQSFTVSEQGEGQGLSITVAPEGVESTEISAGESGGVQTKVRPDSSGESVAATTRPAKSLRLPGTVTKGTTTRPSASAISLDQPSKKKDYKTYTIKRGDTLSALAAQYLGHARYAGQIVKANPGVHPRRLRVGMKLKIPTGAGQPTASRPSSTATGRAAAVVESARPVPKDRAYTVKTGEGWYDLAERFLGQGSRWPELFEMNKDRVPRNPNILPRGTVIELPKKVATTRP